MRALFAILGVALLLAGVFFGGFYTKGRYYPTVVERADTVYVDREITRRDTVTVDRPVVRTIFERTTDTVRVHVPVPKDFRPAGIISPTPIRIDGRTITVTYFGMDGRFVQDAYQIGAPVRERYLAATLGASPFHPLSLASIGIEGGYRWRGLTAYARSELYANGESAFVLGLRFYLFHHTE